MNFRHVPVVAGLTLIAAAAFAEPSSPAPDISGLWQKGPLALLQPVDALAPAVRPSDSKFNERDPFSPLRGDAGNPNLQPRAADAVRKYAEAEAAGRHLPTPQEVCRPSGVPMVTTLPGPMEIVQAPREVLFIYQRDSQVRHVLLQQDHSRNLRPSPYGESIGHYEGDTLVVDTMGMTADTPVDLFGTPHSGEMHVIERYRLAQQGDRARLQVQIAVDDPQMFKRPWGGMLAYGRLAGSRWAGQTELEEETCAENNRDFGGTDYPIPIAARPDF
ncbi:MAG TPA: hypothetical protein VFW28_14265 [Micropepsaceae bacterium]|nr:hypothetical protein [Micropepsaceae bacterium]